MRKYVLFCLLAGLVWSPGVLIGAEPLAKPDEVPAAKPAEKTAAESEKAKGKDGELKEKLVESKHNVVIDGQKLEYTARAGTILLRDETEKPTASIFYLAYTKDGITNASRRPVTFSFNGGPGSSSVWLQLGLLGPRRILLQDDGTPLPPPYKFVDNEYSLLDETDLVFIDPVSTGYSRAVKPEDARKFHGVESDIESVAEFIRLYTTRNGRWGSPKFVIGESYGTTRAAGLSGALRDHLRMNVNGIMLVSTVLNFGTISFAPGNDLPYVLYLPTYAATAWFHKKLPPDLQSLPLRDVLDKAETFAVKDYHAALLRGAALAPEARHAIIQDLARLTGLSADYLDRADLRVPLNRFAEELLRTDNRVIGRFDGRYKGYVRDRSAPGMEYDPSAEAVFSVFASAFNLYLHDELKYESDLPYEILTNVGPWNWGEQNRYLDVAGTLADSLTRNPFLKVYVASGIFDLATPYFATRYTFDHLGIDPVLAKNVVMAEYTAGHMMYLNLPDLKKQKADLARFIRQATAE